MLPVAQAGEAKEFLMKVVRSGIAGNIGEKNTVALLF
jgi:hypothetical protein